MPRSRKPTNCTCEVCGAPFYTSPVELAKGKGRFCSRPCRTVRQRTTDIPNRRCEVCGAAFFAKASLIARGGGRTCSRTCKGKAQRARWITFTCKHCGQEGPQLQPSVARRRVFCSRACQGAQARTSEERTCRCGTTFLARRHQLVQGQGVYCSVACRGRYLTSKGPTLTCAYRNCGREFHATPTAARRGRRYCSQACYGADHRRTPATRRTCQAPGCRKRFKVTSEQVRKGRGKYCSRPCYWRAKTKARIRIRCEHCREFFPISPSQKGKTRYCSQACFHASRAAQPHLCQAPGCTVTFLAPTYRPQRYCSIACANRARPSHREDPRNARVLELHARGFTAPGIQFLLVEDHPEWWMSPANIRKVISRYAAQPRKSEQKRRRKRSVTLPKGQRNVAPVAELAVV